VSTRSLAEPATPAWSDNDQLRADLDQFVRVRRRLFAIAHRIVGNVDEAEDVLQETWLRWQCADRATVINAEAFLVTVTTRLAINLVKSARRRHETYVAPQLQEDTVEHDAGPQAETERGEAIEFAVQLVLERLPPSERAAYVLREGFEYPYRQIAETLQIGAANARQLVTRARARIAHARRYPYSLPARSVLLRAFATASRSGDLTGLETLLAADLKRAA